MWQKLWHWQFMQWFRAYPRWDTLVWLVGIFFLAYWEIMGAIYKDRTTFTDLVRHITPVWIRAVVLLVLMWHFGVFAWFKELILKAISYL